MSAVKQEIVDQWKSLLELRQNQEAAMITLLMSRKEVTDEQILAATNSYRFTLGLMRKSAPRVYDSLAGHLAPTIMRRLFPREIMPADYSARHSGVHS